MKKNILLGESSFFYSTNEKGKYPKQETPEIAFLGRSNTGKSSLINSILNKKKIARISKRPGSTSTINYFQIGKLLTLVDLPGYGYIRKAKDVARNISNLVKDYLQHRKNLKILLMIIDSRRGIDNNDKLLLNFLKTINISLLLVFNKVDKLKVNELKILKSSSINIAKDYNFIVSTINTSCTKGIGINIVTRKIIHNINL